MREAKIRRQPKWSRYGFAMPSITLKNIPDDLHRELENVSKSTIAA
jgi:hypothetical protein